MKFSEFLITMRYKLAEQHKIQWRLTICDAGFVEPWLRWASGAAGKSQGTIPVGGHDGSRPADHYAREAGQQRVPGERHSGTEVLRIVQAVRGTVVEAGWQHR